MARVFIEGFELRHLGNFSQITGTLTSGASAISNFSGDWYIKSIGSSAGLERTTTGDDEFYIAGKWYIPSSVSVVPLIRFMNGTIVLGGVGANFGVGSNHLTAFYTSNALSTNLGEGSINLTTGQVYRIEARYKPSTGLDGNLQVKVNGILDINRTSTVTCTATTTINRIQFFTGASGCLDDIVIDNAEWPGQTKIQQLVGDGVGTSTAWTPSAADNWDCVNDLSTTVTACDADYIYTATAGNVDAYAMAALVEGSNPISEIKCIQVTARAKIDGISTANKIKLKVITTSTVYESSAIQPQENVYAHYNYIVGDTAAITTAHMGNLSIGIESTL